VGIVILRTSGSEKTYLQISDGMLSNQFLGLAVTAGMFHMNVGDYIEVMGYQNANASAAINTYYSNKPEAQNSVNAWLMRVGE
jgi:hypothetical protein